MKDLLIIQHVPFEGAGVISDWAVKNNFRCNIHKIYENNSLPDLHDFFGLVIMGGPMSVNDEDIFPWISKELSFIQECLKANMPIIGVCLGAQFLAKAMGAKVYGAQKKEIGWFPVTFNRNNFPRAIVPEQDDMKVFHWHGETFDLPNDSILLGSSESTKNQLFISGNKILGIQFHLELKEDNIQHLIENCREELSIEGPFIMNEHDMTIAKINFSQLHAMMYGWLDYIFKE